jgi:hypothetical protein
VFGVALIEEDGQAEPGLVCAGDLPDRLFCLRGVFADFGNWRRKNALGQASVAVVPCVAATPGHTKQKDAEERPHGWALPGGGRHGRQGQTLKNSAETLIRRPRKLLNYPVLRKSLGEPLLRFCR